MIDFRKEIVSLSKKRCSSEDYKQYKRVREHNRAMTKLLALEETMYAHEDHCESIARELLQYPSDKVRLSMAAYCLKAGICDQEARAVLLDLWDNSRDRMLALDAYLCTMSLVPCLGTPEDCADAPKEHK